MDDVEVRSLRSFPLTYEQVVEAGPWEGPLYGKYQLCETGCGRYAPHNCIFCPHCYDDFKELGRVTDSRERAKWLDNHRRNNLRSLSPGEQTSLWRTWG